MTDQKTPPAAEQTVEEPKRDNRLIPGGSMKSARTPIGVSAMDHYTVQPTIKAALPDLSDIPGWNVFPKSERR